MERWLTEHYYTSKGRQRAVFFVPEVTRAWFGLELMAGDEAMLEVSFDAPEILRKGQGVWEVYPAAGGDSPGATAVRVCVVKVDGWVKMIVEQEKQDG